MHLYPGRHTCSWVRGRGWELLGRVEVLSEHGGSHVQNKAGMFFRINEGSLRALSHHRFARLVSSPRRRIRSSSALLQHGFGADLALSALRVPKPLDRSDAAPHNSSFGVRALGAPWTPGLASPERRSQREAGHPRFQKARAGSEQGKKDHNGLYRQSQRQFHLSA
jgi:hypothetical protein